MCPLQAPFLLDGAALPVPVVISGRKASPSLRHLPLVCHGAPAGAFKCKELQPRGLLTILCSKIKKVQELHPLFNQEDGAGIKEQNSEGPSLIWRLQG